MGGVVEDFIVEFILKSTSYRVKRMVENEGYINIYGIDNFI